MRRPISDQEMANAALNKLRRTIEEGHMTAARIRREIAFIESQEPTESSQARLEYLKRIAVAPLQAWKDDVCEYADRFVLYHKKARR